MRFFYTHVIPRENWAIFDGLKSGHRNVRRPSLTIDEVWRVLDNIKTHHNRAALTTIYLCGLSISECVNLWNADIHSFEMKLFVHRGKAAKIRFIPLPQKALELLRAHWCRHKKHRLFFPARRGLLRRLVLILNCYVSVIAKIN